MKRGEFESKIGPSLRQVRNVSGKQRAVNTTAPGREGEHLHVRIRIAKKNSAVAAHTYAVHVSELSISAAM